jgi:hypothetical protein
MLHIHKFLKTLLSIAVKKMQLNKQQIFLKMLLLLGRLAFTLNVFGLSVEGDVDAFHCQPTTKI